MLQSFGVTEEDVVILIGGLASFIAALIVAFKGARAKATQSNAATVAAPVSVVTELKPMLETQHREHLDNMRELTRAITNLTITVARIDARIDQLK